MPEDLEQPLLGPRRAQRGVDPTRDACGAGSATGQSRPSRCHSSVASVQGRKVSSHASGEVMSARAARYSAASRGHSRRELRVDRDGLAQQVAEVLGVAPVEGGRRCRRSSTRRRVVASPAGTTWRPSRSARPRGAPWTARATGRSWRIGASPAVISCESRPGISAGVPCPSAAASCGGPAGTSSRVGVQLRVGELLAERVDLGQLVGELPCRPYGPASTSSSAWWRISTVEYCIETRCLIWWLSALAHHPAAAAGTASGAAPRRSGCGGGSRPASRAASFLSVHGTCHTAAPGKVTVGKPASLARSPNSQSSHLMKIGSDRPISLEDLARDQAHEPAVEVDVDALVQPARGAEVAGGEVPVAEAVERRHPPEAARAGRSRRSCAAASASRC